MILFDLTKLTLIPLFSITSGMQFPKILTVILYPDAKLTQILNDYKSIPFHLILPRNILHI